ncbi:MAG: alanine--glyoxylate aminotransferase family protein [Rhodoferax sp.]
MLFTPGPTEMSLDIRQIGTQALPYFRSADYCAHVLELTERLKPLFGTRQTPLTITASGTGGMEMALVNLFNPGDAVLYVNGGTFGAKWGQMARDLGLKAIEFAVPHGQDIPVQALLDAVTPEVRGVLLSGHETSTGQRFDLAPITKALAGGDCLSVVDGVSAIGCDPFDMDAWGVDCATACSQKGLACMPGLVFVAFSERALHRLRQTHHHRSYFDARVYLDNIGRGMLPFTPAMHAGFQVSAMLERILRVGLDRHLAGIAERANGFRRYMREAGLPGFAQTPSNALSSLRLPAGVHATPLAQRMRERHDAILPLNPTKAEDFIRVSHMGEQTAEQLQQLGAWLIEEVTALQRQSE